MVWNPDRAPSSRAARTSAGCSSREKGAPAPRPMRAKRARSSRSSSDGCTKIDAPIIVPTTRAVACGRRIARRKAGAEGAATTPGRRVPQRVPWIAPTTISPIPDVEMEDSLVSVWLDEQDRCLAEGRSILYIGE